MRPSKILFTQKATNGKHFSNLKIRVYENFHGATKF